jgi:zona occludens toxin
MSITVTTWTTMLLTGLRGNGKTLKAVAMMDEFIQAGVPTFACNFTNLTLPGVQQLDDPHGWRDLPPGSVLFVDEAQRFWRSRRSGEPPQSIIEMETQRHDGIRMVLLTQQPTYLDKHLRGLVDIHQHLVRRAGLEASQVYEWERCRDEVNDTSNYDAAEKTIWPFAKKYYGTYGQEIVHTVKKKIPMRLKMLLAAIPLIAGLAWFAFHKVATVTDTMGLTEEGASPVASAAGDAPGVTSRRRAPLTREEYLSQMIPRIAGAAWSAPVYDDANEVQEAPQVYCMIGAKCRCITDQGTRYVLDESRPNRDQALCRDIVENGGILNPFKQRQESSSREWGAGGKPPAVMDANASAPSPGPVIEGEQVSGYGDIGVGQPAAS